MSKDRNQTKEEAAKKPYSSKKEVNEYPRQGNSDTQFGLIDGKDSEKVRESNAEALGKDIMKRIRKGQEEGVAFDPSRSDE